MTSRSRINVWRSVAIACLLAAAALPLVPSGGAVCVGILCTEAVAPDVGPCDGDNDADDAGCPVGGPCGDSTLAGPVGAPDTEDGDATFVGAVSTSFVAGQHRELIYTGAYQTAGPSGGTVTSVNGTTWLTTSPDERIRTFHVEFRTACPAPYEGGNETFASDYTQETESAAGETGDSEPVGHVTIHHYGTSFHGGTELMATGFTGWACRDIVTNGPIVANLTIGSYGGAAKAAGVVCDPPSLPIDDGGAPVCERIDITGYDARTSLNNSSFAVIHTGCGTLQVDKSITDMDFSVGGAVHAEATDSNDQPPPWTCWWDMTKLSPDDDAWVACDVNDDASVAQ